MEFVREDSGFKIICTQYKIEYKKKKKGFLEIFSVVLGQTFLWLLDVTGMDILMN